MIKDFFAELELDTLVRRKKMETQGVYETLLMPSSCRHCVNPECMVGCPTGAIHRKPGGEVDIEPYCIGCGSCATRCPYDNIAMAPTPGRLVDGLARDLIANKCNLCAGYDDGPNCVQNCPTGAILRIEPTSYFEELVEVVGRTGQVAVGKTANTSKGEPSKWIVPLVATILSVALGYWSFSEAGYSPWSFKGMALGGIAFASMLGAVALAGRRRLNRRQTQFGRFLIWTRVHIYLGVLALHDAQHHQRLRHLRHLHR